MTDLDFQLEQELRAQTRERGPREAARVLADFYEQRGQPSRAALWRCNARVHAQREPADLIIRDKSWRRKVAMWLAAHVSSQAAVARAFRSSSSWTNTLIEEVETTICEAANAERHHPTMAATVRLQVAGALPRPYERGPFLFGDPPPENWPATVKKCHGAR